MIRAIALSLVMLIGIGVVLPIATEYVEGGPRKYKTYKKKKKKIKKYSKRWWRLYKARQARRRALLRRKRALRLRQIRLARARARARALRNNRPVRRSRTVQAVRPRRVSEGPATSTAPAVASNWKKDSATPASLQFRVDDSRGSEIGQAAISVVGPAIAVDGDSNRPKSIGGVSTASLRRNVIDQMIRTNGWVVNDYQKLVGNKNVYVVVGQFEGPDGRMRQKIFYFTEVSGRIYSVSTMAPSELSERLAEESEKVINSLVTRASNQQAGLNP